MNFGRFGIPLATVLFVHSAALAHPNHEDAESATATTAGDFTSQVTIEVRGGCRYITSNGIPNHNPGEFPNAGNPNAISPQRQSFRVTTNPQPTPDADRRPGPSGEGPSPRGGQGGPPRGGPVLFGVALNGVVFDPGTAEIWRNGETLSGGPPQPNDWRFEAIGPHGGTLGLDSSNAHVQPTGTYHYHALPTGLIEALHGDGQTMLLIGWAADGYPVYASWGYKNPIDPSSPVIPLKSSYALKQGDRPKGAPKGKYDGTFTQDWEYREGAGDLDRFNGRTGVTPEFPAGTYYYVLTETFPLIPRELRGTPDASFIKGPPPGPGGRPGPRGPNDRPNMPQFPVTGGK